MNSIAQSQETFAQHLLQIYPFTEHFAELGLEPYKLFMTEEEAALNWAEYYNDDSIKLVNLYYEKDFIYFGYEMVEL